MGLLIQINRTRSGRIIKDQYTGDSAMLRRALPTLVTLLTITPALAATPAEQRGKKFAQTHCARCHAIDPVGESPLQDRAALPHPAQALPDRNPRRSLCRGHLLPAMPTMPAFELDPDRINDLLSYLKSLE